MSLEDRQVRCILLKMNKNLIYAGCSISGIFLFVRNLQIPLSGENFLGIVGSIV